MLSYGWILSTCLSLSFIICSHPSRMWDKPGPADQLLLSGADMMHQAFLLLIIFTGKNLCCEHSWWCSCVWRLTLGHYFWLCLRTWSLCLLFCCLLSQSNDAKLKPKMVKVKSQSQNIIGLPALNSFIVLIIVLHLKEEAILLSGHLWSDKCTEKSILLRVNQLWI